MDWDSSAAICAVLRWLQLALLLWLIANRPRSADWTPHPDDHWLDEPEHWSAAERMVDIELTDLNRRHSA